MQSTSRPVLAIFASLLLSATTLAAPVAMKLSPELQDVPPLPVQGRTGNLWRSPLRFAEWQASAPGTFDAKGWSAASSAASRPDEELRIGAEQVAFEFELRGGSAADATLNQCLARGRFAAHTEQRGRVTDETLVEPPGYPRVECKLAGSRAGRLSLRRETLSQRDAGVIEFGDRQWTVKSVNNLASQKSSLPMGRFGYEIYAGGAAIAAVETVNKGRVWLQPELSADEKQYLAAAIAALLSYSVLLESQDG